MECINSIGVGTSPSGSAFQSPPHRGMECIGTTSKNSPNATALSVPSSSGNGVHPAYVDFAYQNTNLSVPSSSGNGVHLAGGDTIVAAAIAFSPLLIGEWSASGPAEGICI